MEEVKATNITCPLASVDPDLAETLLHTYAGITVKSKHSSCLCIKSCGLLYESNNQHCLFNWLQVAAEIYADGVIPVAVANKILAIDYA